MSISLSYPLLKYSCPLENTARPQERSTSSDHQWQHFANPTLSLYIQAGSNGSLQSARVCIVCVHPSKKEQYSTAHGTVVLEDLDLLSFPSPALGHGQGLPLKVVHRDSLVGFRYLHPRMTPEGSAPTYRRFQISFTEPSLVAEFIDRIRPACPYKAIQSQNGPVPRGLPTASMKSVTLFKRPSTAGEPATMPLHTQPHTRTSIIPQNQIASQYQLPLPQRNCEVSPVENHPLSSTSATGNASGIDFGSRCIQTLERDISIPSSPLTHQKHREIDTPSSLHQESLVDDVLSSTVPTVHSTTALSLALQLVKRSEVMSEGVEDTPETSSGTLNIFDPNASSHEPRNYNSNGVVSTSNLKTRVLSSDEAASVAELYELPADQLEKLVGKVVREPGFSKLLEKLDEMWKVKECINRD